MQQISVLKKPVKSRTLKLTERNIARLMLSTEKIDREIRQSLSAADLYHHSAEVKGSYPYIAFHDEQRLCDFFRMLLQKHQSVYPNRPLKLLDVGAGTGRIVYLAKRFGIPAMGIEYHEPYVKLGREYFGLSEEELVVGDAFEMSVEFLAPITVIYTYMPLYNPLKMSELHFSMYHKTQYGTVFAEMLPSYYPMNEFRRLPQNLGDAGESGYGFACIISRNDVRGTRFFKKEEHLRF